MAGVRTAHTADLSAGELAEIEALLRVTFDDLAEHDLEHSLGGLHLTIREAGSIIGHAAVVQRRLLHGDRALRTGYVEGVAVHPAHRRRGHGGELVAATNRVIRGAYELGALGATDEGARRYTAHGWQRWRGPLWALTPAGPVRTPAEDGGVHVLPVALPLDLDAPLTCDYRNGDVW